MAEPQPKKRSNRNRTRIIFQDKKILKLKTVEGDVPLKTFDREKNQWVDLGKNRHWKKQEFVMALDEGCGFINVEYWGPKPLKENAYINMGTFFIKVQQWKTTKNFQTQFNKKVVLVMTQFGELYMPENEKETEQVISAEQEKEQLINVNEAFEEQMFTFDESEKE